MLCMKIGYLLCSFEKCNTFKNRINSQSSCAVYNTYDLTSIVTRILETVTVKFTYKYVIGYEVKWQLIHLLPSVMRSLHSLRYSISCGMSTQSIVHSH